MKGQGFGLQSLGLSRLKVIFNKLRACGLRLNQHLTISIPAAHKREPASLSDCDGYPVRLHGGISMRIADCRCRRPRRRNLSNSGTVEVFDSRAVSELRV